MFHPPLYRADDVQSLDLEQHLKCMCGNEKRLGDCLVAWTHPIGKPDENGWYCVCNTTCYTRNICTSIDL